MPLRRRRDLDLTASITKTSLMVEIPRAGVPFGQKSIRAPKGRTLLGTTLHKSLVGNRMGENKRLGMSFCASSTKASPVGLRRRFQDGRIEEKSRSDVETARSKARTRTCSSSSRQRLSRMLSIRRTNTRGHHFTKNNSFIFVYLQTSTTNCGGKPQALSRVKIRAPHYLCPTSLATSKTSKNHDKRSSATRTT